MQISSPFYSCCCIECRAAFWYAWIGLDQTAVTWIITLADQQHRFTVSICYFFSLCLFFLLHFCQLSKTKMWFSHQWSAWWCPFVEKSQVKFNAAAEKTPPQKKPKKENEKLLRFKEITLKIRLVSETIKLLGDTKSNREFWITTTINRTSNTPREKLFFIVSRGSVSIRWLKTIKMLSSSQYPDSYWAVIIRSWSHFHA